MEQRKNFIKCKHLCYNRLGHGNVFQIPVQAKKSWRVWIKTSHIDHHQQQQQQQHQSAQQTAPTVEQTPTPDPTRVLQMEGRPTTSLMETAVLKRTETIARALLDGGASLSLVMSRLATLLGAKKISSQMNIKGVGGSLDTSHAVELELSSAYDRGGESVTIHCQVVDHVTDVPVQGILEASQMPFLHGKQLADPGRGNQIDLLLIGMPDIPDCYTPSMVSSSDQKLEARESIFGWVV